MSWSNNAGIIVDGDDGILKISDELLREHSKQTHLARCGWTRAFASLLAKSKAPRVINVSSGGGQLTGGAEGWAARLLHFENCSEWRDVSIGGGTSEICGEFVCPGWVRTDMADRNATRSVKEGADTIVWLASEAPQKLSGKFLRDRKEIPW